jgi:ABC-2 type transport system permease protein
MSTTQALLNARKCHMLNIKRVLVRESSFKVLFIMLFVVVFEAGLFFLFVDSLSFLDEMGGVGVLIIGRLFSLFFLGMGLMLIISSMITSYASVFRSEEIPFLITRPFSTSQIVAFKYIESTLFSSWSFFFVIIPFVAAYSWHHKMTFTFSMLTLVFSIPFLMLCSALGTIITMLAVRWFPSGRTVKIFCFLSAIITLGFLFWAKTELSDNRPDGMINIAGIIPGLKLSSNAMLPSWWTSEGIMALAHGSWSRGVMLWLVLASTASVACLLMDLLGRLTFYPSWQKVIAHKDNGRRKPILFDGMSRFLAALLPSDVASMVMKDVRTFFRDPMQWSQVLIFFGLLALYFANLRSFHYERFIPERWVNTIAFVNVFSVSAVMCSLGSRFVYPQLSLEGHGFWILGLSPASMTRIVYTKFATALIGMLVISMSLIYISSHMLRVPDGIKTTAVLLAGAQSFAVAGFSTGFGAIFINLKQRNPSAIVSGFGGTLNLVFCLSFLLSSILPFAMIYHFSAVIPLPDAEAHRLLTFSWIWLAIITPLSTIIPVYLGIRSLRKREF